jgi:hypothetical protein
MTTATTMSVHCPTCGKKGKPVGPLTLRALLRDQFVGEVADAEYYFCNGQACDVVYFGQGRPFTKSQLKVEVGVKEQTGERLLCYCFGHSVASVKAELLNVGVSMALEDVRAKMAENGCRCHLTNPSGSCCLGGVMAGIDVANREVAAMRAARSRRRAASKVGAVLFVCFLAAVVFVGLKYMGFFMPGGNRAVVRADTPPAHQGEKQDNLAENQAVDHNRQIIFAVDGFT